jgi:hypothetical protein
MNVEEGRKEFHCESAKAGRREVRMSTLNQMAPMFLLVQFLVVLLALVAATRLADPQFSLRTRKSSRRAMTLPMTGSRG